MSDDQSYVETGTQKLRNLMAETESGQVKIPQFQRDFVWDIEKAAQLIDSIVKGFPIGAIIYWRTAEKLREVRNLGRIHFPEAVRGERVNYVLDGQQRLTSILASLFGLNVQLKDGKNRDFSNLVVHLNREDEDAPIIRANTPEEPNAVYLPLTQLWNRAGEEYDACDGDIRAKRNYFSDQLRTYDIPKVTLFNAELSVATEVFSRINTGGEALTVFEIMVAKTYAPSRNFDLVEKFDELVEDLQDAGFASIDPTDMLQLIALMLKDDCKKKTILDLDSERFIDTWPVALENLKAAVDYLKSSFRIPVSRLLPYSSMVIPLALFFNGNERKPPNAQQARLLADFFWRSGWSERYSSSADSKLAQDKHTIKKFLLNETVKFDWVAPITPEYFRDETFSASKAFSKTVLALLATLQPQKYSNGDLVNLQNDWLRRAGSLNFHHVFPKAYLRKRGLEDWEANRIVNISLVDDFLNKRVIRARAPSDYMQEFSDENPDFSLVMGTHLISTDKDPNNLENSSPIWSDDYERFIADRASAIVQLILSKVISEEI